MKTSRKSIVSGILGLSLLANSGCEKEDEEASRLPVPVGNVDMTGVWIPLNSNGEKESFSSRYTLEQSGLEITGYKKWFDFFYPINGGVQGNNVNFTLLNKYQGRTNYYSGRVDGEVFQGSIIFTEDSMRDHFTMIRQIQE